MREARDTTDSPQPEVDPEADSDDEPFYLRRADGRTSALAAVLATPVPVTGFALLHGIPPGAAAGIGLMGSIFSAGAAVYVSGWGVGKRPLVAHVTAGGVVSAAAAGLVVGGFALAPSAGLLISIVLLLVTMLAAMHFVLGS